MLSVTKTFYLAIFTLFGSTHGRATTTIPAQSSRADVCAIDPTAIVSDACASYATLDSLNDALSPSLKDITRSTDFFAYYRLNLYDQKCPVKAWEDETGTCGNIACKVDTLEDEKDIPKIWRAEELSKLEGPKAAHPGRALQEERGNQRPLQGTLGENVGESCVVEYDDECDDRDYCIPEDESATAKGDYVSLVDNPERFTGYAGGPVWDAIYGENCFSKAGSLVSSKSPDSFGVFQAANDLRHVIQANAPSLELTMDDECLEKRVFYRIISGMHASISTHICFDYLNQTTGTWGPNQQCYQDRLATHPERISNLYFDYAILLRAVTKLRTYLKNYTFCSGDPSQDLITKTKILHLADTAAKQPPFFDERTMFQDPDIANGLKEDFRNRFRNISRLMDCVGCDKCRLWGKLQTVGYGTALKVLFEYDELKNGENPPLRRTELVALVNTLDRVSSSLIALGKMRENEKKSLTNTLLDDEGSPNDPTPAPSEEKRPLNLFPDFPNPKPASHKKQKHSPQTHRIKPAVAPDAYTTIPIDDDDDDSFEEDPSSSTSSSEQEQDEPLWPSIKAELSLVFRAFVYVLRSWVEMPAKIFRILVVEASRLWAFWLGLPVQGRSWEIRFPGREEL